jgi:hypothetical protein
VGARLTSGGEAAVDGEHRPGDEGRFRAGEVGDEAGDFRVRAFTPESHLGLFMAPCPREHREAKLSTRSGSNKPCFVDAAFLGRKYPARC